MATFEVAKHAISINGRLLRIARLRDEYYDFIECASDFVTSLKSQLRRRANLFTFVQPIPQRQTRLNYYAEFDSAAVLHITSYEEWWKRQINDKTRNMVRKSAKSGVEIKQVEFSDGLVDGILRIYNETPVRQGRRFRHYGKERSTIKSDHGTFLHQSEFFGAYYNNELIGFIKLVHGKGTSNLMQIISMLSHRDKAPTNALIAKAVERCAAKGVPLLHYGTWSRRTMGDFKKHHGFVRMEIPRYYVPLNLTGAILLQCGLHRSVIDRIPETWLDRLAVLRTKWNTQRYRSQAPMPVPQVAERRS
jgi:hypothetical protein